MVEIRVIPETIRCIKMTDEEYFGPLYKEYISNSRLGLIDLELENPFEKFENPEKQDYSESFDLGSAVHCIMLQPEEYSISAIDKPTGKLGIFAQEVFKYREKGLSIKESIDKASLDANYYSGKMSATRIKTAIKGCLEFYLQFNKVSKTLDKVPIYLSKPMKEKYNSCISGLISNSKVIKTIRPGGLINDPEIFNEFAIFCEIDVTINGVTTRLKIKGKIDNFVLDHDENTLILNDLKTSGKPASFFMGNYVNDLELGKKVWYDGSFQKYHYGRQLAMYLWLLQCYIQKEYAIVYTSKVNIVVVETIPNFKSKVYSIGNKHIQNGMKELIGLLKLAAEWKNKK